LNHSLKEALIVNYMPLAKSLSSKFQTLNRQDREQEAFLGLVIAANEYDVDKGRFAAYATQVIMNRLKRMFNKEIRQPIPCDISISEAARLNGFSEVEFRVEYKKVIKKLSADEKLLVQLRLKGLSQHECATRMKTSQATVHRRLNDVRAMLVF